MELFNHVPTGRIFHSYVNPGRDMPAEALQVHGLTSAFLTEQPPFADVVDEFLAFLDHDGEAQPAPARLVMHNAEFDIAFLNMELALLKRPPLDGGRIIVNTLQIARQRFPGRRTAWMRCAAGSTSTDPRAPGTARCSTPNCSPRSISA